MARQKGAWGRQTRKVGGREGRRLKSLKMGQLMVSLNGAKDATDREVMEGVLDLSQRFEWSPRAVVRLCLRLGLAPGRARLEGLLAAVPSAKGLDPEQIRRIENILTERLNEHERTGIEPGGDAGLGNGPGQ